MFCKAERKRMNRNMIMNKLLLIHIHVSVHSFPLCFAKLQSIEVFLCFLLLLDLFAFFQILSDALSDLADN